MLSLALAQLLNQAFPGPAAGPAGGDRAVGGERGDDVGGLLLRARLRTTAIINKFLVDIHLLDEPYGFTAHPMLGVRGVRSATAVFVSLPFTTYVFLAGLQGIPEEVLEAAEVDGASPVRRYFSVILPSLRPGAGGGHDHQHHQRLQLAADPAHA